MAVKVDGMTASRLASAHQQPFSYYSPRIRGEIEPAMNALDPKRLGMPEMPDSPGWREVEQQNVCVHVSGHAAVAFALGQPRAKISLTIVVRPYDGITTVSFSGATHVSEDLKARFDEDDQSSILDYAAAGAAGPLAEAKRCQLKGLPNNSYRCAWGDRRNIDYAVGRAGWLNPQTFRRLAQSRARVALDHQPIWRAVTDLATQLNKGYWPFRVSAALTRPRPRKARSCKGRVPYRQPIPFVDRRETLTRRFHLSSTTFGVDRRRNPRPICGNASP
jgi:hypothetical protein